MYSSTNLLESIGIIQLCPGPDIEYDLPISLTSIAKRISPPGVQLIVFPESLSGIYFVQHLWYCEDLAFCCKWMCLKLDALGTVRCPKQVWNKIKYRFHIVLHGFVQTCFDIHWYMMNILRSMRTPYYDLTDKIRHCNTQGQIHTFKRTRIGKLQVWYHNHRNQPLLRRWRLALRFLFRLISRSIFNFFWILYR